MSSHTEFFLLADSFGYLEMYEPKAWEKNLIQFYRNLNNLPQGILNSC